MLCSSTSSCSCSELLLVLIASSGTIIQGIACKGPVVSQTDVQGEYTLGILARLALSVIVRHLV